MVIEDDKKLKELDSVSKRLKYIVDTLGVKQSHMAQKLGVSPAGLHYILNNDVKFSKNVKKIADYLNVNEQWLETGIGDIYEENTSIKTYKIPVYYPDQLKIYYQMNLSHLETTTTYHITTTLYKNKTLGIYNTDKSFAPKFELGDLIIFEQVNNFSDGEIVLAYLHASNEIVLRYFFNLDNNIILFTNNETPLKAKITEGDRIIGAYRECFKKANTMRRQP